MQKVIHRAAERGGGDYGWLKTKYSFSFADWYEPRCMGYGKLRVINDDVIAPRGKFEMHSHKDFEIITIPLTGAVTHKDNLGNTGIIGAGEVQAMSAGTGVTHSEENASPTESLTLFQIWIEPKVHGALPRYAQKTFDIADMQNNWQLLVSGDGADGSLPIYQDARIVRADLDAGTMLSYNITHKANGVYVLVIKGEVEVEGERLQMRDAIGISGPETVTVTAAGVARLLLIEVPL
jgi:quercetin 2,3-dioxygenase